MIDNSGLYKRAHDRIEELLPSLKGETLTREQWWRLLNVNGNKDEHIPFKKAINDVLWNLSQQNKNKRIVKAGNAFKVVDDTLTPINFKNPTAGQKLDLVLPFGIHEHCFLYGKNIMIVYGSKDAGKTAFLLNVARMNMAKHRIVYWSSEMVEDEFKNRLAKYDGLEVEDWNIEAYERSYDFHEVIASTSPDAVNLIDFLELGGDDAEYYKGVGLVRKVYDVLGSKGAAIIACQKNFEATFPKGGEGLLEKARIAVSLDSGKATLTVAKNWQDGVTSNPKGKAWLYKLVNGANIVSVRESIANNL